jgi:hypothetical protein
MMERRNADIFSETLRLPITIQWVEQRLAVAAYCTGALIAGDQLRAILHYAAQSHGYSVAGLDRLWLDCNRREIELTGTQLRLLLMLARQTLKRHQRTRLRIVKPSDGICVRLDSMRASHRARAR